MKTETHSSPGATALKRIVAVAALLLAATVAAPAIAPFLDDAQNEQTLQMIETAVREARESEDVDVTIPRALMYRGLFAFQDEKYDDSIVYLEESLRREPGLVEAWEALGWAYWRTGEREKALRHMRAFVHLMPDNALAHSIMAQYAFLVRDWELADAELRKSLEIDPRQYEVRFWYAQNLLRLGDEDKAFDIFGELIQEDPGRVDIKTVMAQLKTARRDYEGAAAMWEDVLEELPRNKNALLSMAQIRMILGEMEEADSYCLAALDLDPEYFDALSLRADIAEMADMESASLERLNQVVESAQSPIMRAKLRERLALRCRAINRRRPGTIADDIILGQLEKAVEEDPQNIYILTTYAEYNLLFRRFDKAREVATRVLNDFNPNMARAKDIFFESALGQRQYEDAEQMWAERYASFDANDPKRFYHRARLEMMRGNYDKALENLDMLEEQASGGAILTLLYHDLTESDWRAVVSVRRLYEHLFALRETGFEIVPPSQAAALFPERGGASATRPPENDDTPQESIPFPARVADQIRYMFTAERKFSKSEVRRRRAGKWPRPDKRVAVTFDDGYRNAFELGAPVARSVGAPFGMFLITGQSDYEPFAASRKLIRQSYTNGAWELGSHLHDAHRDIYISPDSNRLDRALVNRRWIPEKKRLESMNEWDARMRSEFRHSREILADMLPGWSETTTMIAYPYGDVGHEGSCNLALLRNPMRTITAEAANSYTLGFGLSADGYTAQNDNSMYIKRYEPAWYEEGEDLVRHAYSAHPQFMARVLRLEVAQAMDKPHLADEMIRVLRRDGYPETLLRRLEVENRAHFRRRPQRIETPITQQTMSETRESDEFEATLRKLQTERAITDIAAQRLEGEYAAEAPRPTHFSLGANLHNWQANDEYKVTQMGVNASLAIDNRNWINAEAGYSTIKQKRRVVSLIGSTNNFMAGFSSLNNATNLFKIPSAKADRLDARVRVSHQFDTGSTLSASLGIARLSPARGNPRGIVRLTDDGEDAEQINFGNWFWSKGESDHTEVVGDIVYNRYPTEKTELGIYYSRDLLSVAYLPVSSDSLGATLRWKPSDVWVINSRGQYSIYGDDNAMYRFDGESFWELLPRQGFHLGAQYLVASASDYNPFYWTPHLDQRLNAIFRYEENSMRSSFRVDFIFGRQREGGRGQDHNDWGVVYYDGTNWGNAWGLDIALRQKLGAGWNLSMGLSSMFLRSYSDHNASLGLQYEF